MKQFILRADDLGYSRAVNHGIAASAHDGMIRSAGLMPNMEAAEHGVELLGDLDIAWGMHTTISAGRPLSDPESVESLIDGESGCFKASAAYGGSGADIVDIEEATREARAQLERFRELVGRDPDYLDLHAVPSANFYAAVALLAHEEGIPLAVPISTAPFPYGSVRLRTCALSSMDESYDPYEALKREVLSAPEGSTSVYVCHPGYLDEYVLTHSSLTINRAREVTMLCDTSMRSWLHTHGVRLIDYRRTR